MSRLGGKPRPRPPDQTEELANRSLRLYLFERFLVRNSHQMVFEPLQCRRLPCVAPLRSPGLLRRWIRGSPSSQPSVASSRPGSAVGAGIGGGPLGSSATLMCPCLDNLRRSPSCDWVGARNIFGAWPFQREPLPWKPTWKGHGFPSVEKQTPRHYQHPKNRSRLTIVLAEAGCDFCTKTRRHAKTRRHEDT